MLRAEVAPIATTRQPASPQHRAGRTGASILATLAGWATATLYSLVFQMPLLWRNAPPGGLALDLLEGLALWAAFTLVVCTGTWCVVVLPLAVWVSPVFLVRHQGGVSVGAAVGAVLVVGWRLGTWVDLMSFGHGPVNPVTTPLFLEYAGFAFTLALVTTLIYTWLLSRRTAG